LIIREKCKAIIVAEDRALSCRYLDGEVRESNANEVNDGYFVMGRNTFIVEAKYKLEAKNVIQKPLVHVIRDRQNVCSISGEPLRHG